MSKCTSGFTLLEMLISLIIIGILSALAMPALSHFLAKERVAAQTYSIWRLVAKTREFAVTNGQRTRLCGLDDNNQCSTNGITKFVIFKDRNSNKKLDSNDVALEYLEVSTNKIYFKAGNASTTLSFSELGYAGQAGGIIICPDVPDPTLIQKITFNRSGRIYLAPDRDKDGRIEDEDGEIIECPTIE